MSLLDLQLARAASIIYFAAAVVVGFEAVSGRKGLRPLWIALVIIGLFAHTAAMVDRGIMAGEVPFTDLFEYTLFLSWAVALVYLVFFRRMFPPVGSLATLVVAFLLLGAATVFFYSDATGGKMPALRSYWLYIHVSLAALGETFFAIAFVASLIYAVKPKASGEYLASLDNLTYRAISMGFPLFTAGALVAGAIWAKQAWGAYWSWDPKEVLSLVVWLVYAAYLHARLVRGLRGLPAAVISIAGFVLTIFTIFGTMFFGGLHSYG
jgi:ABC-type transport system involved in cytochrome c biogenesis permease subunit